jgi:anti-anti-sigma factor
MNVRLETIGQTTLVVVEGRLDFDSAGTFEKQLNQAFVGKPAGPAAVIIDCAGLEYVSSAGLRVFLLAARTAQRAGYQFALCGLQPSVRDVFELSGFSRIITIYADRAAALAHAPTGQP